MTTQERKILSTDGSSSAAPNKLRRSKVECGQISVDNVSVVFGKGADAVTAVDKADLKISAGDFVCILGPSGCGKSTLLNSIAGYLNPSSGSISVDDSEVLLPGPDRGMVFQQGALFEWLPVAKNVDFGLRMKKQDEKEAVALVEKWLDIVGLQGFGDTPTYQLSGGMQQRVALARCLVNDPDVILMDEPLGALDALTREKMQSLVLELWKETGKTIMIITHSVEEALLLGERLFVMAPRPGRIHKEYRLPFAEQGLKQSLRDIKQDSKFSEIREEILTMIWNMEEEIMGGV